MTQKEKWSIGFREGVARVINYEDIPFANLLPESFYQKHGVAQGGKRFSEAVENLISLEKNKEDLPKKMNISPRMCKNKEDCIAASIATLIDRDDVPHVFDGRDPTESWKTLREYLLLHGFRIALFASDSEDMRNNNPDIPYMLMCKTSEGDHAVVCLNGEVVHDPAWIKRKIVGPHSVGFYIVGVLCCE